MNKTIEKIEKYKVKQLNMAMNLLTTEYKEAKANYSDTGYDRYLNKMNKCENEIDELNEYLHKYEKKIKDVTTDEYKAFLEMKKDINNIKSKLYYMEKDLQLPSNVELIGIKDILKKYK